MPLSNPVAELAALRGAELLAAGLEAGDPSRDDAGARRAAGGLGVGRDRHRRAPRDLPDDRAHGRHAARRDERRDAAALRPPDGAARAGRDRGARRRGRARRPPDRPRTAVSSRALRPHLAGIAGRRGGTSSPRWRRRSRPTPLSQHAQPADRGANCSTFCARRSEAGTIAAWRVRSTVSVAAVTGASSGIGEATAPRPVRSRCGGGARRAPDRAPRGDRRRARGPVPS